MASDMGWPSERERDGFRRAPPDEGGELGDADVERVGKRFTGHHWKDGGLLFLIRAVPFMPTTPFSVASGIFKMDIRVFLAATLSGYFVKDLGYVLAGYFGIAKLSGGISVM